MSVEKKAHAASGWPVLFVTIVLYSGTVIYFVRSIFGFVAADEMGIDPDIDTIIWFFLSIALFVAACICTNGFFSLQPGQARVCVLFGKYVGTVRDEGLRWANPFYAKRLGITSAKADDGDQEGKAARDRQHVHGPIVSTRLRTLCGDRLKVNDKMGNPIEIATVVSWRVADTAKAIFDVDDYESYVAMQTETALRHVASLYAYDHMEDEDESASSITLRSNIEEVGDALKLELGRKLAPAGVSVEDARLTHLAYAPEIAQAMLRRQQADAILAARKKIVEGAVSMVEMAVDRLSEGGAIELDSEHRAAMAQNLMVVLCAESDAQPVLNAGAPSS